MNTWGQMIVKNEDRYIFFAITSVINFLDKLLIYDTGSTDATVRIVKYLQKEYPQKIIFKECGTLDATGLSRLRQEMLDKTASEWFLIIDGDEVWWKSALIKVRAKIQNRNLYAVVSPVVNLVGDIYHYQEESAGEYRILGKRGHLNIRFIKKIPGLHIRGEYPLEGYYDKEGRVIQEVESKLVFVDAPLLHFSHLKRSTQEEKYTLHRQKFKYELGIQFSKNFKYPEALYIKRPEFVPSPWTKATPAYKVRALLETPFKKLKRFTKYEK